MLPRRIASWLFVVFVAVPLCAREVWVIRGGITLRPEPCSEFLVWIADVVLHNFTTELKAVRVLDASHGLPVAGGEIVVDANRSRSFFLSPPVDGAAGGPIWITHLEVPDGVLVEGRLEFHYENCSDLPRRPTAAGVVSTPVFENLTPADTPQVHFGTDLGVQPARYNVGVYNAGDVDANVRVEVMRPGCPGDPKVTKTFSVPARRFLQTSVFGVEAECQVPELGDIFVGRWVSYTTVTVDQPSLSYIVSLAGRPQVNVRFGAQ